MGQRGTIYKCPCDRCPHYLQKLQALNWNEKLLQKLRLSQFKLRYQYREYHFQPAQLAPSPSALWGTPSFNVAEP